MKIQALLLSGILGLVFLFFILQVPTQTNSFAYAATSLSDVNLFEEMPIGGVQGDPRTIIKNIINISMGFLGTIAIIYILYGGFIWMTAGGNDENVKKAQKMLTNGVIGLVIIFSAWTIAWFIILSLQGTVRDYNV